MTYAEMLKDPRWQKKRLEILERDGWACQKCGDSENTLHVHHRVYDKGCAPWEYSNDKLVTLCVDCHEAEKETFQDYLNMLSYAIKSEGFWADDVYSLALGLLDINKRSKYPPSVVMAAISEAIKDDGCLNKIIEEYFGKIKIKNQNSVRGEI